MLVALSHSIRLTNSNSKGCTNQGSGLRHIEAEVMGINNKGGQDWRVLCETTPMIWNNINYTSPAHCDVSVNICLCYSLPPNVDYTMTLRIAERKSRYGMSPTIGAEPGGIGWIKMVICWMDFLRGSVRSCEYYV